MQNQNPLFKIKTLILPLVLFSCVTNFAILVSPIFMMQVLDRVVPSENLNTLYLLLSLAVGIIAANGVVEYFRDSCLKKIGLWAERVGTKLTFHQANESRQDMINAIGECRDFLSSGTASTAINIPWIPVFIIALTLIHVSFLFLIGAIVGLSILIKSISSWSAKEQNQKTKQLMQTELSVLRDATDPHLQAGIRAISENLFNRYSSLQEMRQSNEVETLKTSVAETSILNTLRMSSQILSLSLGAALVVKGDLSAGGMIGASILSAKTIQTIEAAFASLPKLRSAFSAHKRFETLQNYKHSEHTETSSDINGTLECNGLIFPRGGGAMPRLDRVSLSLTSGQCLAIIGDSGSGKTTLLHALCGIETCPIGSVFFNQTEVRTLGAETIKSLIGYLPQQARLVRGTIAENISCFEADPKDEDILNAAKTAGVHGLISALPASYQTDLSTESYLLSSGQKQRVALARAIYYRPKYLFLDEPNALLDAQGERQLFDTLALLKKQGTTIIMIVQRTGVIGLADKVMLLNQGKAIDFGSRAEVLSRLNDGKQKITIPLNTASLQDLNDWIQTLFNRHTDQEFAHKTVLTATELFNSALQNGPDDIKREATFVFKFTDQNHCELVLSENNKTEAAHKMPKIKSLINHPEVSMIDLQEDEISLAVLAQLSDTLKVENVKGASFFTAQISSNKHQKQAAA